MFESIKASEIRMLDNINLIDIRSVEKYNSNHILNAKNIPLEELLMRPQKYLSKDEIYYIYCQKGIQSRKVCPILIRLGYKVINVSGGYEAWILSE